VRDPVSSLRASDPAASRSLAPARDPVSSPEAPADTVMMMPIPVDLMMTVCAMIVEWKKNQK
jgi:hypothetical protein